MEDFPFSASVFEGFGSDAACSGLPIGYMRSRLHMAIDEYLSGEKVYGAEVSDLSVVSTDYHLTINDNAGLTPGLGMIGTPALELSGS